MIFEPEPAVELVSANIEVVGFEMQRCDARIATGVRGKFHRGGPNPFRAMLRPHVELIDEAIGSVELEREAETEDQIADDLVLHLEQDQSSKSGIVQQSAEQMAQAIFVVVQLLKGIEVLHQREQ